MSIDWDIEELACRACGKTEEEAEHVINNSEIDDLLDLKYGIDFEAYCEIVKDLLPFTPRVRSGITEELFHAFVDAKELRTIVKQKA